MKFYTFIATKLSKGRLRMFSTTKNLQGLYGRDLSHPLDLNSTEIQDLLWTAFEVKTHPPPPNLLSGRHVTLVMSKPNVRHHVALQRAAYSLGAQISVCEGRQWGEMPMTDFGMATSRQTDAIFLSGLAQKNVHEIADGSNKPVVNLVSDVFGMFDALADFMTMMEVLGSPRRRWLAWVGPATPLCCAYLYLAPKIGMNFRVFRVGDENEKNLEEVLQLGVATIRGMSSYEECSTAEEAVYRADVITTAMHAMPGSTVTSKMVEEAAVKWYIIHSLPKSDVEVSQDACRQKNNLTWPSHENSRFLAMALVLNYLKDYSNTTPKPDFS